jgi:hypothetical protein
MGSRVWTLPSVTAYSGALNFDEGASGSSGPAGGDLAGANPSPNVVALHSGATQLAIGAVADGQLLARSGANLVGIAAPGGAAGNVYFDPPASPNALNDEFKSGSSALNGPGGRGFLCVNATSGATMTRVGDVLQAAPALGANEYRSTLTASGMYIQAGSEMVVYKAVSGSLAVYADMRLNNVAGSSTGWFFEAPCLFGVAPLVVSNTVRRIFINCYGAARALGRMDLNQVYTTIGSQGMSTTASFDGCWAGYISWNDTAKTFRGLWLNPSAERYAGDYAANSFPAFTPIAAGVVVMTPNQAECWVCLRTFRVYPVGVLPGIA